MTTTPPKKRSGPPRGLLISIAVLLVVSVVSGPLINGAIPEDQRHRYVLLTGVPFLTTFAAFIIGFIAFIWWLGGRLNRRISARTYRPIEAVIIGGIVLGVFGMFQGWVFEGFQIGFPVLLVSTFAFMVWSHIIPAGEKRPEEIGPVSVDADVVPPVRMDRGKAG